MDNKKFHILERFSMKKNQKNKLDNFWEGRFKFYCINGHYKNGELDPLELVHLDNKQMKRCPKYYELSLDNPEGRNINEHQCYNNLSFIEEEKIINHFAQLYQEAIENAESVDYRNYKFKLGSIELKVLLHEVDKDLLHIGFINHQVKG